MKSRISFCKKELIVNNLKMYGALSVLWGIYLFLVYPLLILTEHRDTLDGEGIRMILFSSWVLIAFIVPLVMAMMLFHFLKTDSGVAFHMSLPATKSQIFFSQFVSGVILYALPLLINAGLILLAGMLRMTEDVRLLPSMVAQWFVIFFMLFVANFFVSTAIGMVTGSVVWQIIFVIIYFCLPTYFNGAGGFIGTQLLRGFGGQNPWQDFLASIDLAGRLLFRFSWYNESPYWEIAGFITMYALVMFVFSYILYRFKKMESNREWISFGFMKAIFIVGFTTCFVVLMAAFFHFSVFHNDKTGFYVGAAIGAVLGYIIAAMIAWKTIYLKKAWLGVFVSLVLTLGIVGGIDADIFGFETYVPLAEQIEEISFYGGSHPMEEVALGQLIAPEEDRGRYDDTFVYKETESIELVRQLHQELIADGEQYEDGRVYYCRITYHLKNGKIVYRNYDDVVFREKEVFRKLMLQEETVKKYYIALDKEAMENLLSIKVSSETAQVEEQFTGEKMKQLLALIQKETRDMIAGKEKPEILTEGSDRIMLHDQPSIRIRFELKDLQNPVVPARANKKSEHADAEYRVEEIGYYFYGEVPEIRQWLEKESEQLKAYWKEDTIDKLTIYRVPGYEMYRFGRRNYFELTPEDREQQIAEISDKQEFERYLEQSGSLLNYDSDREFIVILLHLKNGSFAARTITEKEYEKIRK